MSYNKNIQTIMAYRTMRAVEKANEQPQVWPQPYAAPVPQMEYPVCAQPTAPDRLPKRPNRLQRLIDRLAGA